MSTDLRSLHAEIARLEGERDECRRVLAIAWNHLHRAGLPHDGADFDRLVSAALGEALPRRRGTPTTTHDDDGA